MSGEVWGKDGSIMGTLTGHDKAVTALAVFEDDTVASGSADGTVRLWYAFRLWVSTFKNLHLYQLCHFHRITRAFLVIVYLHLILYS